MMYHLPIKRTGKKRVKENAGMSYFETQKPRVHWFIAQYLPLRTW